MKNMDLKSTSDRRKAIKSELILQSTAPYTNKMLMASSPLNMKRQPLESSLKQSHHNKHSPGLKKLTFDGSEFGG